MRAHIPQMLSLLTVFLCQGCFFDQSHDNCEALKAYNTKKNQMPMVFANKSVFKRGNGIILEIDKGKLRNSFFSKKRKQMHKFFWNLQMTVLNFDLYLILISSNQADWTRVMLKKQSKPMLHIY